MLEAFDSANDCHPGFLGNIFSRRVAPYVDASDAYKGCVMTSNDVGEGLLIARQEPAQEFSVVHVGGVYDAMPAVSSLRQQGWKAKRRGRRLSGLRSVWRA